MIPTLTPRRLALALALALAVVTGRLRLSAPLAQDLFVTVNPLMLGVDEADSVCPSPGGGGCGWFVDVIIPAGATQADLGGQGGADPPSPADRRERPAVPRAPRAPRAGGRPRRRAVSAPGAAGQDEHHTPDPSQEEP